MALIGEIILSCLFPALLTAISANRADLGCNRKWVMFKYTPSLHQATVIRLSFIDAFHPDFDSKIGSKIVWYNWEYTLVIIIFFLLWKLQLCLSCFRWCFTYNCCRLFISARVHIYISRTTNLHSYRWGYSESLFCYGNFCSIYQRFLLFHHRILLLYLFVHDLFGLDYSLSFVNISYDMYILPL